MGVRLVKYGLVNGTGTYNHDELLNRDLPDQHPISAITGLEDRLKNASSIENIVNTASLTLEYDKDTKTLTGNVNIFNSEDNALELKTSGLFVDKYLDIETEDTKSVHLTMEGKGETLKTMYESGTVFSHNGTWTNVADTSEANAWYYDEDLESFVQPQNTTTFTGFVSTVKYRTYTHRATLKSTSNDNDGIGLIIAYALDENKNPHTLSVIVNKGGESHVGDYFYALVYDKDLPDEQVLFTKGNKANGAIPGNHSTSNWDSNTITVEVNKAGSTVTCATSNYGSTIINQDTLIEIDLDSYEWGYLFRGKTQYGYCAQSQPNSYYLDIYFKGKGPLKAEAIISPDEGNSLIVKNNGLYCAGGSGADLSQHIVEQILSEKGVHGLRYYNSKLQYLNKNNAWTTISTGGGSSNTGEIIISPAVNNALVKYANGYYVPSFVVSGKTNNALQKLSDGYYVPSIPVNNATTDDIDAAIDKVDDKLVEQEHTFNERYDLLTTKILEISGNTTKSKVHEFVGNNQNLDSVIDISTLYNLSTDVILNLEFMLENTSDVDSLTIKIIENDVETLNDILTKSEVQRYKLPNIPNIEIFIKGAYRLFLYVNYV